MLKRSRLLIDGDRFRTESPEGNYEGIFNIDVEAQPHEIDIEFIEGPEAGDWNYGIFRLNGDRLDLCLDLNGRPRPATFGTSPGSGHAHEILNRTQRVRPDKVAGGSPQTTRTKLPGPGPDGFNYVASPTTARLQGEWSAVKIVRDGLVLPPAILRTATRSAVKNEIKISVGGKLAIHALVKIDESCSPAHVDYYNVGGMAEGSVQHGQFKWDGDEVCFCLAPPGAPRPENFEAAKGSGRSFSQWRRRS